MTRGRLGRGLTAALAAVLVALGFASAASSASAVGPLTFESCVSQPAHDPCSAAPAGTLGAPQDVVVNPAGTDVYVIGSGIASHFKRAADGTLTYADCASDSGANGCNDLDGAPLAGALDGVLSPDGKHLYVSGAATIATLKVSATGSLSYEYCSGDTTASTCLDLPNEPINFGERVAVTPSGNALYVASFGGSSIARFSLGSDGYPTYQGCYASSGGSNGCADLPGTPLNNPYSLAVSSDGGDLYATGNFSSTIVHFQIGAGGALTYDACKASFARDSCEDLPNSPITAAGDVVVSPNGSNVYVVSGTSQSITRFTTDNAGHLSYADCLSTAAGNGCSLIPSGSLQSAIRLTQSPDGTSLYASDGSNSSLLEFDVAQAGQVNFRDCLSDTGASGCTDLPGTPLVSPSRTSVTADGKELLVSSHNGDGLARFLTSPPASPDSTPPETKVGKRPEKKTTSTKAKFTFSSNEAGTTFTCALDKKDAKACTSPYKVKVKPGRHKLAITATDAAGNAASPTVERWKVVKKKHKKH